MNGRKARERHQREQPLDTQCDVTVQAGLASAETRREQDQDESREA